MRIWLLVGGIVCVWAVGSPAHAANQAESDRNSRRLRQTSWPVAAPLEVRELAGSGASALRLNSAVGSVETDSGEAGGSSDAGSSATGDGGGEGEGDTLALWLSISAALVLLLVFIVAMHYSCRRNGEREADMDLEAATATFQLPQQTRRLHRGASNRSTAILTPHDEEDLALWRLDVENIEPIRPLGAGAYGTVWLATYLGETVVVKKLSPPLPPSLPRSRSWRKNSRPSGITATAGSTSRTRVSPAQTALQRFVAEIRFLATLSHPKIVAFYGVAWTSSSSHGGGKGHSPSPNGPTDLQMVLEYMSRGDLRQYLARTRGDIRARAWSSRKLAMALDIAEALAYLHSRQPDPVLHRDLKSRNILLDATYTAKVADFGVSRYGLRAARPMEGEENAFDDDQEDEMAMTRAVGTSRWIAPEVLAGETRYSTAVDVYSFGVILSELDSHELPFADVSLSNGESLSEHAILELLRAGALQPTLSDRCPRGIAMLMFECLTLEPTLRPTSAHVADRLRSLLDRERRVSDVGDDVHLGEFNGQNSFLGVRAGEEVTSGYSSSISIASSSGISEKHGFHYALLEED